MCILEKCGKFFRYGSNCEPNLEEKIAVGNSALVYTLGGQNFPKIFSLFFLLNMVSYDMLITNMTTIFDKNHFSSRK